MQHIEKEYRSAVQSRLKYSVIVSLVWLVVSAVFANWFVAIVGSASMYVVTWWLKSGQVDHIDSIRRIF